jgi:uncharacterized protein DUF3846
MEDNARRFWGEFAQKYRAAVNEDIEKEEQLLKLAAQVVEQAEKNAAEDPTSDKVLIVMVEPNKRPYKLTVKNDLNTFQGIVGGYVEHISISERPNGSRIGIFLNEEGKLINLPPNRLIIGSMGGDEFVGTFCIVAHNLEGDTVTLTDVEAEKYIKLFGPRHVVLI